LLEEATVVDLDQQLRECLRRHADEAYIAPHLAAAVRARSRQLARRARATIALALVPATAGATIGSIALADAGSPANHPAQLRTTVTDQPPAGSTHCPRNDWPSLQRLGRDTAIATRPIGIPTFIRRYAHQHPNVATLSPTRKVIVDDHRLSPWSYAIEIVSKQGERDWQLMIGTPPHSDHNFHKSTVSNAQQHGCIAVREG
jgi:hypothetical protein